MNRKGYATVLVLLGVVLVLTIIIYITVSKQKDISKTSVPSINITPNMTSTSEDSRSEDIKNNLNVYKGSIYPYEISYPAVFNYENHDISPESERAVFKSIKTTSTLKQFVILVYKGELPDSNKIYIDKTGSQKISGEFSLTNKKAIYIELPHGQGEDPESNIPRLEVYVKDNDEVYSFIFYGVSDSKDITVNQILTSFKLLSPH